MADVDNLVRALYSAATTGDWSTVSRGIRTLTKSDGLMAQHRCPRGLPLHTYIFDGIDPATGSEYAAHYWRVDPFRESMLRITANQARRTALLLPSESARLSEYINDFARPHGVLEVVGWHAPHPTRGFFAIGVSRRNESPVEAEHLRTLERLAPHVTAALDLHCRLSSALTKAEDLRSLLDASEHNAYLLDETGRLLESNRAGANLLAGQTLLWLRDGKVEAVDPSANKELQIGIRRCAIDQDPAPVQLRKNARSRPALLLPRPETEAATARVALLVPANDPLLLRDVALRWLREQYATTNAESVIALHVASGKDIDEVALLRGVAPSTVKNQLKRAMGKLGVSKRHQLVHLLGWAAEASATPPRVPPGT